MTFQVPSFRRPPHTQHPWGKSMYGKSKAVVAIYEAVQLACCAGGVKGGRRASSGCASQAGGRGYFFRASTRRWSRAITCSSNSSRMRVWFGSPSCGCGVECAVTRAGCKGGGGEPTGPLAAPGLCREVEAGGDALDSLDAHWLAHHGGGKAAWPSHLQQLHILCHPFETMHRPSLNCVHS